MKDKKRVGFLSYWGFGKGIAYDTLCFSKMLISDYDIYILKQGDNEDGEEFKKVDVNIQICDKYTIESDVFRKWVKDNKLDAVVFNEYNQWLKDPVSLVKIAKEEGAKTYGFLIWEKLSHISLFDDYDKIIAPTVSYERYLRKNKIRNFVYIPMSVDLEEFPKKESKLGDKFVFFHPGGWGGYKNRKCTQEVISAFMRLNRQDTELIITAQKKMEYDKSKLPSNIKIINEDLSRKDLIKIFYESNAVVLPSKWETIGIPILEAMAAGKPVITNDVPPMNEFVKEGLNGYLCRPEMTTYKDVFVGVAIPDETDLKNKMENVTNKILYPLLAKNARYIAESMYDIKKNKKYFIDSLKEVLQ